MRPKYTPLFGTGRTQFLPYKKLNLKGGYVYVPLPNIDNLTDTERLLMMFLYDNPMTRHDHVINTFGGQYNVKRAQIEKTVKSLTKRLLLTDKYDVTYCGELVSMFVDGFTIEATYKPHVTRHIKLTAPARKLVELATSTRVVGEGKQ